jgi:hypothetical protein
MNYLLQAVGQLEFFANYFGNVFNILMTVVLILLGMICGVLFQRYVLRPKNQVLYLRERDGRGHEMDLKNEDAISFTTKTEPQLRFFKYGRAYEFIRRGRAFTRFLGKEGTAYTWSVQGFHKKNPNDEPEKITLEFPSLEAAVKFKWGQDDYARTPEELQSKLRDDKIYATVNLEPGITPEGYQIITESTVNAKADEDAASLVGKELEQATKTSWIDRIITMVAGAGILAIVLIALGKLSV